MVLFFYFYFILIYLFNFFFFSQPVSREGVNRIHLENPLAPPETRLGRWALPGHLSDMSVGEQHQELTMLRLFPCRAFMRWDKLWTGR